MSKFWLSFFFLPSSQINPYAAGPCGLCVCLALKNAKLKSCQAEGTYYFKSTHCLNISPRACSLVTLTTAFLHH